MLNINNYKSVDEIIKEKEKVLGEIKDIALKVNEKNKNKNFLEIKNLIIEKKEELNNLNLLLDGIYNYNNKELINLILKILNGYSKYEYKIEIIIAEDNKSFESYTSNYLPGRKKNIVNDNLYTVIAFTKENIDLSKLILDEKISYDSLNDLFMGNIKREDIIIYDLLDYKINVSEYLEERTTSIEKDFYSTIVNKGLSRELLNNYNKNIKK